jgi:hypothetical protein
MRKLALLGPISAVLLIAGLFENNIETSSSNGAIDRWLAANGNAAWMEHAVAEAVAAVALLGFAHVLCSRLAPTAHDPLGRLLTSLGAVLCSTIVVGAGLFAAVPVGRFFEDSPQPDASVYRYLLAASASVLVIFLSIPAAAFAATASALALRNASAPRWLGYAGVVLSMLMLVSAFVAPLMVFGVWLVVTGTTLAVVSPRERRELAPAIA